MPAATETPVENPTVGPSVTSKLRDVVALTKPRITLMVLVTALGGIYLAPTRPSWSTIALALLGTALVVASANTLNCWLERDVDKFMTRTKDRPLPAGRLSASTALVFGLALGAGQTDALMRLTRGDDWNQP